MPDTQRVPQARRGIATAHVYYSLDKRAWRFWLYVYVNPSLNGEGRILRTRSETAYPSRAEAVAASEVAIAAERERGRK